MKECLNELISEIKILYEFSSNFESINKKFEKTLECITDIKICAEHEENILNDNLDYAKITENKLQLAKIPFDFKNIIEKVIQMLKGRATKKGLEFKINLPTEALWVKADPLRVTQILMNLLSNAVKFTDQGYVEVKLILTEQTSTYTTFAIEISDTGIGLSETEQSKLFERFSQANISLGDQYGGSGLGLVIAKNLARLMGGDISVKSKKGIGSTFFCTIQCDNLLEQEKIDAIKEHVETQIQYPSFKQKLTILIVDDNVINRKVLETLLEKEGYKLLIATDGLEAVAHYSKAQSSKHPIDIIFMDIVMPNLDGLGATQEIRRLENEKHWRHVPIIALTGNALPTQQIEARDAGMDAYITKPFKIDIILREIEKFFPLTQEAEPASSLQKIANSKQLTIYQTFFQPPSSKNLLALAPNRTWMSALFRNALYPYLDELSIEFNLLDITIKMPEARFYPKISRTGWQLYSVAGTDEYWAAINLEQDVQTDNLVAAIQKSGAHVIAKKMKSGATYSLVIIFSSNISLNTEIAKVIPSVRAMFNPSFMLFPKESAALPPK